MTANATIKLEFPCLNAETWTKFEAKTQLAEFEWCVSGEYCWYFGSLELSKMGIECNPIGGTKLAIWNCEACGQIVAFSSEMWRSELWSASFEFVQQRHVGLNVQMLDEFFFEEEEGESFNMEVQLEVANKTFVDLSSPHNNMLLSPEDGAPVDVGGAQLWLSKSLLGGHSPFFKTLFYGDFKEKLTGKYELKDICLDEFMHFISLIYGTHFEVDVYSLEYLFKLADYFQCDLVRSRCRNFLVNFGLPLEGQLHWMDRYRFFGLVVGVVEKMNAKELKNFMKANGGRDLSPFTQKCVTNRLLKLVPE